MKNTLIIALFVFLAGQSMAQNILDVINLNPATQMGSPRFVATGGAFTALGNDFSAVHLNPAGLAVYRHDEFGVALGWANRSVNSAFYGSRQIQDDNGFIFYSIGYVVKLKSEFPEQAWTLGITWNKNNDFGSEAETFGVNNQSSILQSWIANANGIAPNDLIDAGLFYENLAWETFLLDIDQNNQYFTQAEIGSTEQFIAERIQGRYDEVGITLAQNKNDKLYYGFSVNIPFYRYNVDFFYEEAGFGGDSISGLEWQESFTNNGIGFNVKAGFIYRPIPNVRVAASLQSPTWMGITQEYQTSVTALFRNSAPYTVAYENQTFDYSVRSAPQARLGAAYVFDKYGFISVDYQFIPIKWSGTATEGLEYLNDDIKAQLQNQHNIRFGAEVRLNTIYLRGGYNWLSNPFDLTTQDATQNTYSFGIGYRQNKFTLDLGYAIQRQSINFYPYSSAIVEPAIQRITRKPLVLSASFRL